VPASVTVGQAMPFHSSMSQVRPGLVDSLRHRLAPLVPAAQVLG
jgi:hypothetical protein